VFITDTQERLNFNSLVLSGFEYVEQMPIGFFDFANKGDKDLAFKGKVDGSIYDGTLTIKNNGFKPVKNDLGELKAQEVCVVSRAKTRPVLIFQDTTFCEKYHDNVFVIPIQTLRKPDRNMYPDSTEGIAEYNNDLLYYQNIVDKNDKVYDHYYFPKVLDNGQLYERVLILSDARFIHKSFLIKPLPEDGLNDEDLKQIGIRLSKMLNIKNIEQCRECEYSFAIESIKKILSRVERVEKKA